MYLPSIREPVACHVNKVTISQSDAPNSVPRGFQDTNRHLISSSLAQNTTSRECAQDVCHRVVAGMARGYQPTSTWLTVKF